MITTSLFQRDDGKTIVFWLGGCSWETSREEFSEFVEAVFTAYFGGKYGGFVMKYVGVVYINNGPSTYGLELRFGGNKVELQWNQVKELCDLLLQFKYKSWMEWTESGLYTKEESREMNEKFWRYQLLGESAL